MRKQHYHFITVRKENKKKSFVNKIKNYFSARKIKREEKRFLKEQKIQEIVKITNAFKETNDQASIKEAINYLEKAIKSLKEITH